MGGWVVCELWDPLHASDPPAGPGTTPSPCPGGGSQGLGGAGKGGLVTRVGGSLGRPGCSGLDTVPRGLSVSPPCLQVPPDPFPSLFPKQKGK